MVDISSWHLSGADTASYVRGRSRARKIMISSVRCDRRNAAPLSKSISLSSETDVERSGSVCRQPSIRVRRGWARARRASSVGDSQCALTEL